MPPRGRPKGDGNCADCRREGVYTPKKYGSYCYRHFYIRQRNANVLNNVNRNYVLGDWQNAVGEANMTLTSRLRKEMSTTLVPAKTLDEGQIVAEAFEYACVMHALTLGTKMTRTEEDEIIDLYGGSRTGTAWSKLPRTPVEPNPALEGPLMLPDPLTRRKFRAMRHGGPTTVGEPAFEDYYKAQFPDSEVPAEFRTTPTEIVEEDVVVEGITVSASFADEFRQKLLDPTFELPDFMQEQRRAWLAEHDPVEHYIPEDPEALMSVSELMEKYDET